jgi:hypothetical protein
MILEGQVYERSTGRETSFAALSNEQYSSALRIKDPDHQATETEPRAEPRVTVKRSRILQLSGQTSPSLRRARHMQGM